MYKHPHVRSFWCCSDPTCILFLLLGHVNVAPRHLTAEAETLLSATLIHEVMHVLGFDPHAFTHFRDERKRRRGQVLQYISHFILVIYFLLFKRDPNAQHYYLIKIWAATLRPAFNVSVTKALTLLVC